MKINEEYITKIEKLANTGLGITRIDGMVVFVANSCPNDTVKIRITTVNKKYCTGEIIELIEPSSDRITPFCPMYKVCGACQLQNIKYQKQLELKREITADTIHSICAKNISINNTIASPETIHYRHKIQYPISQTKNSERILAGYYKPKSHEIVNIKYCPIQPEICDRIIEFIRNNAKSFGISGYNEKKHFGDLRHVVIRNSCLNNENLVVLVVNATQKFSRLINFANEIYNNFEEISGVCVNYNSKKTNVIMSNNTELICGKDFIIEEIDGKNFRISANTFFQVNPKSAENIFKYVKNFLKDNCNAPTVLDAYAGISSFGICISDVCKKVITVEEVTQSCELAKIVAKENNINNIEIYNEDATKFLINEQRSFDAVILDPPRKGCSADSLRESYRLAQKFIIYISCNPATLARDLKILSDMGCSVQSVQPFDMFCHTYHIENVAIINVNKN